MKYKYSLITFLVIALLYVGFRLHEPPRNIITYDIFGTYLYLPSLFIHNDLALNDISFIEDAVEKYRNTPTLYQLTRLEEGNWMIRFFIGISIMYLPFFLGGHLYALNSPYPADGFSEPYQWALIISGIFYTLLGLFMMRKVLLRFFSDTVTSLTMIFLFIGSNIVFFTTLGNDSPHVYVFTLYTFILWLTIKWHETPRYKYAILLGLVMGLTVIARPSEMVAAFIPVLWGVGGKNDLKWKWDLVTRHRYQVAALALAGVIGLLPQFIYWLNASGSLIVNTYNDPASGLNLLSPRFGWALFSFRKGLYAWSPMLLAATLGFIPLFRQNRKIFFALFVFFLLNAYLISSYSSLISFGWRAFIQSYAVMAIPLGYMVYWLSERKLWPKIAASAVLTFIIILNLFQMYQWRLGVLDGSRMTREYYLATFFSTKVTDEERKLLLIERPSTDIETIPEEGNFSHEVLYFNDFEDITGVPEDNFDTSYSYSGDLSIRMDSKHRFSPGYKITFEDLTDNYYAWIRASVKIRPNENTGPDDILLVAAFDYNGKYYKYRTRKYKPGGKNGWKSLSLDYLTPEPRTKKDHLNVYVWYRGQGEIYIDDLKVELYEPVE